MIISLEVHVATIVKNLPKYSLFKQWVRVIFSHKNIKFPGLNDLALNLKLVDETEMIYLNTKYRNKPKVTNVLAFGGYINPEFNYNVLGDLVICAKVIQQEAKDQHKELSSHWAHMVIHGTLHLLGYDHITLSQARKMEKLEINLMQELGFSSPY